MAKKQAAQSTDEIQDSEETVTNESNPDEAADVSDLVKMHKDGQTIHAHPHVIAEHKKNGWKLA
jgi:hypothetical protein